MSNLTQTRILIIADLERMRSFNKISDNRVKFIDYLIANCPEIMVISRVNLPITNKQQSKPHLHQIFTHLGLKQVPNIVVHYLMGPGACPVEQQILVDCSQTPIMTCLWLEDSGHIDKVSTILSNFKSILFSVKQSKISKEYLTRFPHLMMSSLDHYIDDTIFRDYSLDSLDNQDKLYDIVFYGYVDHQYPFRGRLLKLLQANKNKFRLKYIPHPGYHQLENKKVVAGENLAQILNSSILSICTRSKSDMLLKKYLEALFCGCIPCGDIPTDYRKLLEGKMLELTPSMSDEMILTKILGAIKDRKSIQLKTTKTSNSSSIGEEFRKKFNYDAGAIAFVSHCQLLWKLHYLQKKI